MEDKVLMHVCCAPCSVSCIEMLQNQKINFEMFWYNPNIHPYTEYKKRMETLGEYTTKLNIKLHLKDEYGLEDFVKESSTNLEDRCGRVCYYMRLNETAKKAKELNFKKFTTTLLVSPYQNREKLIEVGNEIAKQYGLEFIAPNFHEKFWEGQRKARELGLYMQKYCGCIFSEAERYKKNTWKFKNISIKNK